MGAASNGEREPPQRLMPVPKGSTLAMVNPGSDGTYRAKCPRLLSSHTLVHQDLDFHAPVFCSTLCRLIGR
jgi:hypothetical protein